MLTLLLGESYQPGGLALTRRLVTWLDPAPTDRVLAVASTTTALAVGREWGVAVDAVDPSTANVALARGAAAAVASLGYRVTFALGDAAHVPHPDATFDVALCERGFPDRADAVELARILRPGGRLGITGVVADPARLPAGLGDVAGLAETRPLDEHVATVTTVGLRVRRVERHDTVVLRMIDQIEARLDLLRRIAPNRAAGLEVDLGAAQAAVANRTLGYGLLVADKPVV